jgi:hypothetical protein
MSQNVERVVAYIDGFNLYFGIVSKFGNQKWLNVQGLANSLLRPNQQFVGVKIHVKGIEQSIKNKTLVTTCATRVSKVSCGPDGTRTRDLRRDRPAF